MKFVDDADENSVEPVTDGPSLSDPSVRNEFAVAGYRWGHAQLMDEFNIADENLNFQEQIDTVDTFFNPDTVYDKGPAGCLRGAMQRFTGKVSGVFWPTFQDNLFRGAGADHGSDLLSFNIAVSSNFINKEYYYANLLNVYFPERARTWSWNISCCTKMVSTASDFQKFIRWSGRNASSEY